MSAFSFGLEEGSYETAAALTSLGTSRAIDPPGFPHYPGAVLQEPADEGVLDGNGGVDNGDAVSMEGHDLPSDSEYEMVRGSGRQYKRRKRSRFRKMTPRLADSTAALESIRTEREVTERRVEAARAELEDARRRLEEAESELEAFGDRISAAEEAVVDAEIEEPNSKWNVMYKKLIEWKAVHGHTNVPSLKVQPDPEIKHLANWVANQRLYYALPPSKGKSLKNKPWTIVALNRIGFTWKVKDHTWDSHYAHLLRFKESHGHCNVPYTPTYEPDPKLVTWLNQQRAMFWKYKRGEESHITPERIRRLTEAGVDWTPTKNLWMTTLEKLRAFKEKHGHTFIPEKRSGPDFPLAQWVRRHRVMYDKNMAGENTSLTPERMRLLEEVGLYLDTKENKWRSRYRLLLEFKEKHGNMLLADRDHPRPMLKAWAQEQRKQHKAKQAGEPSDLTDERELLLREAGFCLELDASWYFINMMAELKSFYDTNSHFDVPETYESEPRLRGWVEVQRKEYRLFREGKQNKKGKESFGMGKILVLEELGFDWRYND
mmetsp:Transcript_12885/g.37815  ORF Transcript_12885/g.37815 Transcript_12885/m.37815 type:complete len:545 (-) Transcript_12885:153-1787(-)|eukprot:CAMPEP_0113533820 /NCGR_PEP_ID=MMETSP0015_2-20120614/4820_1 /TAXON_ID=2838 /ORGANISM="Odontella" /LENGTH=544 /DNA_ID=CAMNT_0000432921 /DNA_START=157 /DNA_END=1791 /DNA_ORIENTATION=+ /assembly_acc=CAM_ASM_000160